MAEDDGYDTGSESFPYQQHLSISPLSSGLPGAAETVAQMGFTQQADYCTATAFSTM